MTYVTFIVQVTSPLGELRLYTLTRLRPTVLSSNRRQLAKLRLMTELARKGVKTLWETPNNTI